MLNMHQIRSIRGAPLTILCVLVTAGQPVNQAFCERSSGYSEKTVSVALHALEDLGYVSHSQYYAWEAMPEAKQLFITTPGIPAQAEEIRRISGSMDTAATTIVESAIMGSINKAEAAKNEDTENFRISKNVSALRKVGVYGAKAQEIAALAHVTPRYIKAHAAYAERRKDAPGLMIRRMLDGDPAPKRPASERDESRKYIEGKYAAFIEH